MTSLVSVLNNQGKHLSQGVLYVTVGSSPTRHQQGWEKGASTPVVNYKLAVLLRPIVLAKISETRIALSQKRLVTPWPTLVHVMTFLIVGAKPVPDTSGPFY